jgi:hypothetical protein
VYNEEAIFLQSMVLQIKYPVPKRATMSAKIQLKQIVMTNPRAWLFAIVLALFVAG